MNMSDFQVFIYGNSYFSEINNFDIKKVQGSFNFTFRPFR